MRVVDLRTFEARATLRAPGFAVGAVWTNACLGPDERHAAAGDTLVQHPSEPYSISNLCSRRGVDRRVPGPGRAARGGRCWVMVRV